MENCKLDAEELLSKMFKFIPIEDRNTKSSMISAKYCAMVACDYLFNHLPNINLVPPIHRESEDSYRQHWMGVKAALGEMKF